MEASDTSLPIEPLLSDICRTLGASRRLVLAAPPGAGKTTRVPLAVAGALPGRADLPGITNGRVLLLEPRRIAARMAAARMADTVGERIGQRIGLSTRLERKVSKETIIEVITDGLFARRILADPLLEGIGAVMFDEFHERSLNGDLGLALAIEAQGALRPDLHLLVMSATLDTGPISEVLSAPVIESEGRQYPVETIYLGRAKDRDLETHTVKGILRALRETEGSILVFLPGAREIRRTQERLNEAGLADGVTIHPLFGALSPAEQDAAISPAPDGRRKIVLATDIAESALTIEGVHVVIDAGLSRVPDYNPSTASTQLVTRRVPRDSADQRRGRAGRLGPGKCYRLWDEAATRGLPRTRQPEILNADLSGLLLALAEWGEGDPARLTWLDAPPVGRLEAARKSLTGLGALAEAGRLTDKGRAMAKLPLPPRLAALIVSSDAPDERAAAALLAALLSERGMGGASTHLGERMSRFRKDRSPRARALLRQAERWGGGAEPCNNLARRLAAVWPEQIARRREGSGGQYLLASGRAAHIDPDDKLARSDWLVIAEMVGAAASARITLAAPLGEAEALEFGRVERKETAAYNIETGQFQARRVTRLGAIILSEAPLAKPSGKAAEEALKQAIDAHGARAIRAESVIAETLSRIALLRLSHGEEWPDWTLQSVMEARADWLFPILDGQKIPSENEIRTALIARLEWPLSHDLDRLAPLEIKLPSGRRIRIDYLNVKAPLIEARVQEFYGAQSHPAIADGRVPLTLSLLSPARRPAAITSDLPGFWAGGYADMAKDMRAQYPKHDWPEVPASARPHEGRTKKRL